MHLVRTLSLAAGTHHQLRKKEQHKGCAHARRGGLEDARHATENVAHVGEDDAPDQDKTDQAGPGRDVDLDVQQECEPAEEGRDEVSPGSRCRCWRAVDGRSVVMSLRIPKDEVDARLLVLSAVSTGKRTVR